MQPTALGEHLTRQGRYVDAEPLLLSDYECLRALQGLDSPRTQLALRRLVALYQGWGKPGLAERYRSTLRQQRFSSQ
ncbi:MAG: tetratricopeptide repeat protein [Chthoniobacterales bacterium]